VEPIRPVADATYREIGIRSHGKGIFHKPPVSGSSLGDKRVFKVVPECFVVNIVFAWEQAIARTTKREEGMIASHRFPMYRAKPDQCDIDFLTYYFKSRHGKHLLQLASPGGAGRNKTLGQRDFEKLSFPMPPRIEQAKVAKILQTWDAAIGSFQALTNNNKELKIALAQQLLTGRRRLPHFRKQWRKLPLSALADVIVSGVDKKASEGEARIRLCNYTDVYHNKLLTNDMKFMFATATRKEIKRCSLLKHDVVITKDSETPTDIGVPALVNEDLKNVVCGYHLAIVRARPDVAHGPFLAHLFTLPTIRNHFFSQANGATRFGLSVRAIETTELYVPSIEEQNALARRISFVDEEAENLARQMDVLKNQRAGLMQQLLTGKRRVKLDSTI
jgi:type I restriction enzyme, S subunit